jgi:hypothetical protein
VSLPYERATSGSRAVQDISKILRGFGCSKFGSMIDDDAQELIVQFEFRGRGVLVKASIQGYAAAWLKAHPGRGATSRLRMERKAKEIASTAVYSILRDWIKGQVTAVETGILTFEGAFLGQLLLPSGQTVLDMVNSKHLLAKPAS